MKNLTIFLVTICISFSNLFAELDSISWTAVGLGGGGAQFSPAISPIDSNLMFVSCDMSGVYKTTNQGKTWKLINFRQLKSSIRCGTIFHPFERDILWDDYGRSLMKSTDAGETWFKVWDMPNYPEDMIISKKHDNSFTIFIAFGEDGLFKSSNGNDFTKVTNVSNAISIAEDRDIIVASSSQIWISKDEGTTFANIESMPNLDNPNRIIAVGISGTNIFVLEENKLWKTSNNGLSWVTIANSDDYQRGTFRFLRTSKNYVWLTTSGGAKYQPTALLSTDYGENFEPVFFCNNSWDDISNLENGWLSLDFNCGWGGATIGFNISKTNPQIALWTDDGRTLMTTDGGKSWQAVYTKFADDGIREAGKLWKSRGLEVTSSWDIFIPDENNNFINVAYTDIGGAYSQDKGNTWRSTYDSGIPDYWKNTTYNFAFDKDNSILWGAFSGRHDIPGGWSSNYWQNEGRGGVAFSTDNGMHWIPLIDNGLIDKPVTSIAIDFTSPKNNRRLYVSVWSDGIWRSVDGGKTWQRASKGLDCGNGSNSNEGKNTHVVEVQVHPDGTVFALKTKYIRDGYKIKNDAGLWKSTDQGDNWEFISEFVADCPPNTNIDLNGEHSWADAISFLLDENDVNHIYVGAQNVNNGKVQGGLYETVDGGQNWTRIYQTYAAFRLTKSKYYPNRMYLATSGEGIVISEDNGDHWKQIHNFPFAYVTKITEDPLDSNIIWVNTFGGGVWKGEIIYKNTTAVNSNNSRTENQIKIYPNPFSEFITFNSDSCKQIDIYDLFGRKIFHSNESKVQFIPDKGLPEGIYYVKFTFNKRIITKKIILMR